MARGSDGATFEAPPVVELYIGDDDAKACRLDSGVECFT